MSRNREALLREIQEIQFTTVELQLFLDTHPENRSALADYVEYSNKLHDLILQYSKLYGPLIGFGITSEELDKGYRWINSWPWEDLGGNR
ncbi:MAG: spore coat protein CotJB [Firmicutes bacterium]|nr:spore coat protein CotJB [Bacillota bacterium]MDD4264200.1 spore coat protein CotJB [Bacillota bacterium]MDD4693695.1 spore coat protein CotJB [Bacillota bacterium]